MPGDGSFYGFRNFFKPERFGEASEGAKVQQFSGVGSISQAGDHDHRSGRVVRQDVSQQLTAVQARHRKVGKHRIVGFDVQIGERLFRAIRCVALVRHGQKLVQRSSHNIVVVDDQ